MLTSSRLHTRTSVALSPSFDSNYLTPPFACLDCDLKVMHKSVSRHHADIVLEANAQGQQKLLVTDLSKVHSVYALRKAPCCASSDGARVC